MLPSNNPDLSSSNITSNLFLGALQRPWMHDASPQHHPQPRPHAAAAPAANPPFPALAASEIPPALDHLPGLPSPAVQLAPGQLHEATGPMPPHSAQPAVGLVVSAAKDDSPASRQHRQHDSSIDQPPTSSPIARPGQPSATLSPQRRRVFEHTHPTTSAASSNRSAATKRTSNDQAVDSRRIRARADNQLLEASAQLPTPHNSPVNRNTNASVLAPRLESQLAILRSKGIQSFDYMPSLDHCRTAWLRDACKINDMFYIIAHLIYCAWSSKNKQLLDLLMLTRQESFGVASMEPIWLSGHLLHQEVARLFLQFPDPLHALTSPQTSALVDLVKNFFVIFPAEFPNVRSMCAARGYPPSPIELTKWLSLPSPSMQRLLYMTVVQTLTSDKQFLSHAVGLFDREAAAPIPANPGSEQDAMNRWASYFSQLVIQPRQFPPQATVQQQPVGAIAQRPMVNLQDQPPTPPIQPAMSRTSHGSPLAAQAGSMNSHPPSRSRANNQRQFATHQPAHLLGNLQLPNHQALASSVFQPPLNAQSVASNNAPTILHPAHVGSHRYQYQQGEQHQFLAPVAAPQYSDLHPGQYDPTVFADQSHRSPAAARPAPNQAQTRRGVLNHPQSNAELLFPIDHRQTLPHIAQPDPASIAIHQVEAHSPRNCIIADSEDAPVKRFYRYVERIMMLPQSFNPNSELYTWKFRLPEDLMHARAQKVLTEGEFPVRKCRVVNGSTQFRLKCMKRNVSDEDAKDRPSCTPNSWPECISVSINGDFGIDFRRKAHFGLDLSTDVTELLQNGVNEVKLCINFTPKEENILYYFGLEIIRIADDEHVKSLPKAISSDQIKSNIMRALSRNAQDNQGDDDVVISDPVVSIDMVDPIMSTSWVTPVRGDLCQHRECFDLEAFLLSRTSRTKGSPLTNPDQWKCPICKKDARPQHLIIDEFLVEVRKQLEAENMLHTKAILVKEDGTWEAKGDALKAVEHPKSKSAAESLSPTVSDNKIMSTLATHETLPEMRYISGDIIVLDDGL